MEKFIVFLGGNAQLVIATPGPKASPHLLVAEENLPEEAEKFLLKDPNQIVEVWVEGKEGENLLRAIHEGVRDPSVRERVLLGYHEPPPFNTWVKTEKGWKFPPGWWEKRR